MTESDKGKFIDLKMDAPRRFVKSVDKTDDQDNGEQNVLHIILHGFKHDN